MQRLVMFMMGKDDFLCEPSESPLHLESPHKKHPHDLFDVAWAVRVSKSQLGFRHSFATNGYRAVVRRWNVALVDELHRGSYQRVFHSPVTPPIAGTM